MKTVKAYTKRLKVTKHGKILMRGKGQNHFNAKARRRKQLNAPDASASYEERRHRPFFILNAILMTRMNIRMLRMKSY